jgi:hypothetical protein
MEINDNRLEDQIIEKHTRSNAQNLMEHKKKENGKLKRKLFILFSAD